MMKTVVVRGSTLPLPPPPPPPALLSDSVDAETDDELVNLRAFLCVEYCLVSPLLLVLSACSSSPSSRSLSTKKDL
jgi:hypothetical protein